jgi:hypothetical protein
MRLLQAGKRHLPKGLSSPTAIGMLRKRSATRVVALPLDARIPLTMVRVSTQIGPQWYETVPR